MTSMCSTVSYEAELCQDCPYEDIKELGSGYVTCLSDLIEALHLWKQETGDIPIYYPLKTNSDEQILKVLVHYGHGAHCNSKYEMEKALKVGFPPDKIMAAFPYKTKHDFTLMKQHGISLVVASCEEEIRKIHKEMPVARVLLRVWTSPNSLDLESYRFSCHPHEVDNIARTAAELGIDIIGVCFYTNLFDLHKDCTAHYKALQISIEVMECLVQHGFRMKLVSIGGGFPNAENIDSFREIMKLVQKCLTDMRRSFPDVQMIAEPGTFLLKDTTDLYMQILGKRQAKSDKEDNEMHYTVNQSAFRGMAIPLPIKIKFKAISDKRQQYISHIWGDCCPPMDIIQRDVVLPELEFDDWICIKTVGAYCGEFQTNFQSNPCVHVIYTSSPLCRDLLQNIMKQNILLKEVM